MSSHYYDVYQRQAGAGLNLNRVYVVRVLALRLGSERGSMYPTLFRKVNHYIRDL